MLGLSPLSWMISAITGVFTGEGVDFDIPELDGAIELNKIDFDKLDGYTYYTDNDNDLYAKNNER